MSSGGWSRLRTINRRHSVHGATSTSTRRDEEDAARDDFMRSMRAGEVVVHAVSVALFQTMRVFKADPDKSTDNSEGPADHAAAK
ncbi:hypothetical protein FOZ63_019537, partial [Perkinsus olseni]